MEQPEFPIVERMYFIQFMFPVERANPGIILQDSHHAFATVHDIENEPLPSDGVNSAFVYLRTLDLTLFLTSELPCCFVCLSNPTFCF